MWPIKLKKERQKNPYSAEMRFLEMLPVQIPVLGQFFLIHRTPCVQKCSH